MRFALPLTLLLATLAPAAPVPGNEQAEKRRHEALWKELDAPEPVARVRAAFGFLDDPNAAAYLKEKLPPVEASKEQITKWLKDLDSDDEKVWKAAYEQLEYFNPQLALTLPEQLELVTTDNGKRVLFHVWGGMLITFSNETTYRTELTLDLKTPEEPRAKFTSHVLRNGLTSTHSMGTTVEPLRAVYSSAWGRAELAARTLHRMNTKESRAVLERLASGHKDARLTRTAAQLLKAKDAKPEKANVDDLWAAMPYSGSFDAVFDLIHTPDAAKLLKPKLPAIKASKEQMTAWLKALDNEDPKVWRPVFDALLVFRPRIALDWQEQIDTVTTAHGRTALFQVWHTFTKAAPDKLEVDPGCTLGIEEQGGDRLLKLSIPGLKGEGHSETIELKPMDEMFSYHWRRVRMAIVALERMNTDDAKAVLKQLADGHPDILPTKEAKAALERMK